MISQEKRFAVLIDADNVSAKYIKYILDEVSNEGNITYKRIYGDWTKPQLASWKTSLLNNSIIPIQQYNYTTGKNSTDSALIIDAMDILYSNNVDGFCIVSSDSDFTRLAARLRESGMTVLGMGYSQTPDAFVAACNKFTYLEVFDQTNNAQEAAEILNKIPQDTVIKTIYTLIEENSDDTGKIGLAELGTLLIKRFPNFDVRNYGHSKLSNFIRSFQQFSTSTVKNLVYVQTKEPYELPKPTPKRKSKATKTTKKQ